MRAICTIVCIIICTSPAYSQVFVNADASVGGDGKSWSTAFNSFQMAIDSSQAEDDLWLMSGAYTVPGNASSFSINKPINIYGGFSMIDTSINDRDIFMNITTLNGDRNGDDIYGDDSKVSDNAKHVVHISGGHDVTLDGVLIRGGVSNTTGELGDDDASGGGVLTDGNLSLIGCFIFQNTARFGGGIYMSGEGNHCNVMDCLFDRNIGERFGGGIYADNPNTTLDVMGSIFEFNLAESGGGIITGSDGSFALVEGTLFSKNVAEKGAGIQCDLGGNITVNSSGFLGNIARLGAGLRLQGGAQGKVDDCIFAENSVVEFENGFRPEGAAIQAFGSSLELTNSVIEENSSTGIAGGIAITSESAGIFSDNFFTRNTSDVGGSAVVVQTLTSLTSNNNFFDSNTSELGVGGAMVVDANSVLLSDADRFSNSISSDGGAIYIEGESEVHIESGTFESNSSPFGGAISLNGTSSDLTVEQSEFNGNSANYGGCIYSYNGANSTITNSNFNHNRAEIAAGAIIYDGPGQSAIHNSEFTSNSSVNGGAISTLSSQDTLYISGSRFRNNTAQYGGGIELEGLYLDLQSSFFIDNKASDFGGGICVWNGARLHLSDSEFNSNMADIGGGVAFDLTDSELIDSRIETTRFLRNIGSTGAGAINQFNTSLYIENSLFRDNIGPEGSAIWADDGGDMDNPLTLVNNTLVNRDAANGPTITLDNVSTTRNTTVSIQNTILFGSSNDFSFYNGNDGLSSQGGNLSLLDNSAHLDHATDKNQEDPLFIDTNASNFRLSDSSPAINGGVLPGPLMDLNGDQRLDTPDIGAYENQNINTAIDHAVDGRIYVNPWAKGASTGRTWRDAYATIYDATRFANPGDEIWIAKGVYTVPSDMNSFDINKAVTVYGGFRGGEMELEDRIDNPQFATILSGDRNGDDMDGDKELNKSDNAIHVVRLISNDTIHVRDITIRKGGSSVAYGGGVFVDGNATLSNVIVHDNVASRGGGIYIAEGGSVIIDEQSEVHSNCADFGGGVYSRDAYMKVIATDFHNNNANTFGGGVYAFNGKAVITSSTIHDNVSELSGGGIKIIGGSNLEVDNTLVTKNSASLGGGLCVLSSEIDVKNSTFDQNTASRGGAIRIVNGRMDLLSNTKFSKNSADAGGALYLDETKLIATNNSFVENVGSSTGGAVELTNGSNYHSQNSFYISNQADEVDNASGGAIIVRESVITLVDDSLANNKAKQGGAFYMVDSEGSILSSHIVGNMATFGGGICNFGLNTFSIDGSNFANNNATNTGGAINLGSNATYDIIGSVFEDNTSGNVSGAIFVGEGSIVNSIQSEYHRNFAPFGGAYGVRSGGQVYVDENWFITNSAETSGGGFYVDGGSSVTISNSGFENSRATFGAAIFASQQSFIEVDSTYFRHGYAEIDGGAIMLIGGIGHINNSRFRSNGAFSNGGAIAVTNDGELTLKKTLIIDNRAYFGAGLSFLNGEFLEIDQSEFNTNRAELTAGGISVILDQKEDKEFGISNTKFICNQAEEGAGAINHFDGSLNVTNAVFDHNSTSGKGSAIWTEGHGSLDGMMKVVHSTFYENPAGAGVIYLGGIDGNRPQTLRLQNNIFANSVANFILDDAEQTLISNGGNLSASSDSIYLNLASDVNSVDPKFIDPSGFNFRLQDDSPAINIGVSPSTFTDLDGNGRVGEPDAGAYENQNVIAKSRFRDIKEDLFYITVSPNPVPDMFRIVIPKQYGGSYDVEVLGVNGINYMNNKRIKGAGIMEIDASTLSSGTYVVRLIGGDDEVMARSMFVKN